MSYKIVSADEGSVTLWDGKSRDPDHPQEHAGLMTVFVSAHSFSVGDEVEIVIKSIPVDEPEYPPKVPFCARHGAFHNFGLNCINS